MTYTLASVLTFALQKIYKFYLAGNEGAVTHAVKRRCLDGSLERIKLIFPIVQPEVSFQCTPSVFLWTFDDHLIAGFSVRNF